MKNTINSGTFLGGALWPLECLLIAILLLLLFTCAPAILVVRQMPLPPAYALKAERPLADTAQLTVPEHAGERSHGAKLTPRLVGSVFLWMATRMSWHPYLPATLFGLLYIFSGIVIGYQLTGDKVVGLFLGLVFSGLYTTSACFSLNWMPKPFDGVAVGFLALTLLTIKWPQWLFVTALMSCWTDERLILALCFVAIVVLVWPEMTMRVKMERCALLCSVVVIYGITRAIVARAMGWSSPDMSIIGLPLALSASFAQLAAWSSFEGGWIPIVYSLWLLLRRKSHFMFALYGASVALALAASLVVLDVSRSGMFSFPLILAAVSVMKQNNVDSGEMRRILCWSAGITLLAPNFEIIAGVAVKWLPPYFVYLMNQ